MIFHNESNYDYHFIIKNLAKEFQRKFNGPGRNTEKKSFQFQWQKKLKDLIKMENKLQKPFLTNYNLLIAQDLCQAYYQILLIILLNDFIKSNAKMDMIIKNVKHIEISSKIVNAV